ncbi:MAG: GMC family oxidoreductase [Gemmatimonadetes bacterium]|nr:GMC family oxidoreductase [Gemmatimonadota bacterium]
MRAGPTYQTREPVDFVVIGSGAGGGVMAKQLSEAGFQVVVLEQGPYIRPEEFVHDEYRIWLHSLLTGSGSDFPSTFRSSEDEEAGILPGPFGSAVYARMVGGSSVHFTGNYWRFRPVDFQEGTLTGGIDGTGLADWPITYEELEPYYSMVEWQVGVSGAPGPGDPPRSRPYPMPPLPVKSSGVLLEQGARALGWTPQPAPMAILSRSHEGRSPCIQCGWCMGYGCEVNAKSSSLASVIPKAEATGRCEIRPLSTVYRIETDASGRANQVLYFDAEGQSQAQRARAVVLSANGAESARLLLSSDSNQFPDGLANSSGLVGKYLMFNGNSSVSGLFEHPLNEYKGPGVTRVVLDEFYDSDPQRGFYGGGGLDGRTGIGPIFYAWIGTPPDGPQWGTGFKEMLRESYTRTMDVFCHGTSLPLESNNVTLDPEVKDKWGRPAVRITYRDHDDDLAVIHWLRDRAGELLDAAGARQTWALPYGPQRNGFHLLGTARMGTDPSTSVVDPYHRAHDVPGLYICDGSNLVTSGRGQPTMTIQALAFRAAEHLIEAARRGEV